MTEPVLVEIDPLLYELTDLEFYDFLLWVKRENPMLVARYKSIRAYEQLLAMKQLLPSFENTLTTNWLQVMHDTCKQHQVENEVIYFHEQYDMYEFLHEAQLQRDAAQPTEAELQANSTFII